MRPAVKSIPEVASRIITAAEVRKWSANGHKPWPSEACTEIAASLTKMRWPQDLPESRKPGEPRPPWDPPPPDPATEDPWWNPPGATAAARALLEDVPAMLWHWHWMQWAPEARPGQKPIRLRDGYKAVEQLRVALNAALPFIEWPFGEYKRQDHRKKSRPSDWHMHAGAIAGNIRRALMQSGRRRALGFSRDTAEALVVHEALMRIGYCYIETNTIAAYLQRQDTKFRKTT
jgi:hypothetical protein